MKVNVQMKNKSSMLHFQLGLIIVLLTTLFVLEFNFKETKKEKVVVRVDKPTEYTITNYKIIPTVQKEQKTVETKVVTKTTPKVSNEVKIVKHDVNTETTKVQSQDETNKPDDQTDVKKGDDEDEKKGNEDETTKGKEMHTAFSVEQLPMFAACKGLSRDQQKKCFDEQLYAFIMKNISYPEKDLENGKQGTALVEFIIDENGQISNVIALDDKRATEDMQKAAVKAVKKLPKLIPAKQGDENVQIKYTIPIAFKVKK